MKEFFCGAWSWIIGGLSLLGFWAFGSEPSTISILYTFLVFAGIDTLFGIIEHKRSGTFRRQLLLDGLYRKFTELCFIIVGRQLDASGAFGEIDAAQKIITLYLIFYELLSILNHITIAGVPIPKIISDNARKMFENLVGKGGDNNE